MTSHAITEAIEDGTAYYTLQEGVKAHNKDDKETARHAFKGSATAPQKESPWEYMLNQQTLKHVLIFGDYAPPVHQLVPITAISAVKPDSKIELPKYSPSC